MSGTEWKPGVVIDGLYEVRRVLGIGGMGAVYEVFHRYWQIPLAVKTALPAAIENREGMARFLREAESWSELGIHPNVVTAHYVRTIDGSRASSSSSSTAARCMTGSWRRRSPGCRRRLS